MRLYKMENEKEFDEIFRLYYSKIFIFALQMINDEDESHDIISSVYEHIWKNFKTIKNENVQSYLYTLVKTRCINYLRQRDIHEKYIEFCIKTNNEEKSVETDDTDTNERIERILSLLQFLPSRDRDIMEACYIDHKKYQEIADEFNLSLSYVKKIIAKVLNSLRNDFTKKT